LFVIGGGSGGVSAARWGAELGKKSCSRRFRKAVSHWNNLGTWWNLR